MAALVELKTQAIFDGEMVALDDNVHPRFEWIVRRGRQKGTALAEVSGLPQIRSPICLGQGSVLVLQLATRCPRCRGTR